MLYRLLPVLSLVASVLAIDFSQWSPPADGDVRSPCPALNTMANHGILPHDGKGLSVPMLMDAMRDTFNVGTDLQVLLSVGALFASSNPLGGTIDLDDLDKHNIIEHDGSLSRADYNEGGDDYSFRQDIFDTVLAFFGDQDTTTISQAAKAKFSRVHTESLSDSSFTYGAKQFLLSYGESAFYLMGMGDPLTGIAPVEHVKIFFEQERLPYAEGWRTPSEEINLLTVNLIVPQLIASSGETIPEGLIIANNTLARAFLGLENVAGEIPSAMQNLLNKFGLGGIF